MKNKFSVLGVLAAAAVCGAVSATEAAQLVNFIPVPVSPTTPEFALTGSSFSATTGTVSSNSADPLNPVNQGGLLIETPFTIPGAIPGSVVTATGSTQFYDVTLVLSGSVTSNALSFNVPGQGAQVVQPVTGGSFTLYASSAVANAGVVLLSGTFANGSISGTAGDSVAGFNVGAITYTSGVIYNALLAALGGNQPQPGSLSVSLNDLSTPLAIAGGTPFGIEPVTGVLNGQVVPFTANATGLFSTPVIPEPGVASLLAGAGLGLIARRRR